jgi:hypothetical protein
MFGRFFIFWRIFPNFGAFLKFWRFFEILEGF